MTATGKKTVAPTRKSWYNYYRWNSGGTAAEQRRNSGGTAAEQRRNSGGTAAEQRRNSGGTA
ncbi:MAG: hypothetical protein LBH47_03230, partial [Christensenellaceae bacterium]|nr:hypothetical protein [Christensenellaceae bacterium]